MVDFSDIDKDYLEAAGLMDDRGSSDSLPVPTNTFPSQLNFGIPEKPVQTPINAADYYFCLLYTSPSPRDGLLSRMPSSA